MITNQKGYALLEGLIGAAILSVLTTSLLHLVPHLIESKAFQNAQQSAYNALFEERAHAISQGRYDEACHLFNWRDHYEEICL